MSEERMSFDKHNKIIESSYKLSLVEQKIVLAGIRQINDVEIITSDRSFIVSVSDVIDSTNQENNNYTHLKKTVKRLYDRSVMLENYENGVLKSTTHTRWLSDISYWKNDDGIRLNFSEKLIPHLSEIQKKFTKYKAVAGMKSIYSIRLYELLVPWLGEGEKQIDVKWLKEQLHILDKYQRFTSLRKRVLDVAVNEINKQTSLTVSYLTRKTGKSITHILFTISSEDMLKFVADINHQKKFDDVEQKRKERLQKEQEALLKKFNELEADNQARFLLYFMEHISEDKALSVSYRKEGLDNADVMKAFINYLGSG